MLIDVKNSPSFSNLNAIFFIENGWEMAEFYSDYTKWLDIVSYLPKADGSGDHVLK